ncbi:MAG: methyltransferase, partial [Prevotella sp.]|nr:methyltransferase [Prevotella sp.]
MSGERLLDDYVLSHSDAEPEYLHRLWRETNIRLLHGRMASGHLQGRLLKMLVQMVRPESIVEVGTFSGYSALCMGEGLASLGGNGHLWTFETNDELEPFTRKWI